MYTNYTSTLSFTEVNAHMMDKVKHVFLVSPAGSSEYAGPRSPLVWWNQWSTDAMCLEIEKGTTYMLLYINALDFIDFCVPVVLPRIHLCVLHSVFLGEEHEGIHWPLAFCRSGNTRCPWGVAPVWFGSQGLWGAGALKFITVWTDGTPARQGGPALTSHAAENVHCGGI